MTYARGCKDKDKKRSVGALTCFNETDMPSCNASGQSDYYAPVALRNMDTKMLGYCEACEVWVASDQFEALRAGPRICVTRMGEAGGY